MLQCCQPNPVDTYISLVQCHSPSVFTSQINAFKRIQKQFVVVSSKVMKKKCAQIKIKHQLHFNIEWNDSCHLCGK